MKRFLSLITLGSLLLSACSVEEPEISLEVGTTVTAPIFDEESEETIWDSEGNRYTSLITNPSSGAELFTYLDLPEGDGPFPMVMLIPGGSNSGTSSFSDDQDLLDSFLDKGIAVAYFDPDGRGKSTGKEDVNGFTAQDGLYAVTQALMETGHIDTEEMGMLSYSFGITLASGMLARYSEEQPYEWFIDWEGPSAREYTTVGCETSEKSTPLKSTPCDDDEYWAEREAVTFLAEILVPYWRVQGERDHVQATNEHAIAAINAAANGTSPWTRINNEDPNQIFSEENKPEFLGKASRIFTLEAALELFDTY